MAVIDYNRAPAASAGLFGSVFGKIYIGFANWQASRATRAALVQLSDRELEDIGLSRGDIEMVARSA